MSAEDIVREKGNRGKRKGVLTKQLSSLQRHVADGDVGQATAKLDVVKEAFVKFEEAHLGYHDLLQEEDAIDESDEYFLQAESNYTDIVSKARNWVESRTDKKVTDQFGKSESSVTASVHQLVNLPKVELDTFDGSPSKYHAFMAVFEECVEKVTTEPGARLSRLLQYTKGKAHAAIASCPMMAPEQGYDEAKRILKHRFGNDDLITESLMESIQRSKAVKTPEELQDLVDEVSSCHKTLTKMGKLAEVDSRSVIKRVVERLQRHMRFKWRDYAVETHTRTGCYPTFADLVTFLAKESDKVNDPAYGFIGGSERPSIKTSGNGRGQVFTAGIQRSEQRDGRVMKCHFCKREHRLYVCKEFERLKLVDRLRFVNENALCHLCFGKNHKADECRSRYRCTKAGCGDKHSAHVHIDTGLVNAGVSLQNEVYLPVIDVNVLGRFSTGALLDTGSSGTFCSKTLTDFLGIKGSPLKYSLSTLGMKETKSSTVVDLDVVSADGSHCVRLSNVIVVDKIPVQHQSHEHLQSYPHISELSLARSSQVDLIIGLDHSELLVPLETRTGASGEPYACRTILGWTVNGPGRARPGSSVKKSVVSHFIQNDSLEGKVQRLWDAENEGLVGDSPAWSVEDREVIDLWSKEMELVDGRFEIPIPWKDGVYLPNNIVVAKSRLRSLRTSLDRRGLWDRYSQEVDKLLSLGFAEPVPREEIGRDAGVWYLPHQAVLNPNKPGKVRLVFDCAAKFNGESLNDKVKKGPDLNNKLLPVLLRFRQHAYAIQGDIEAMYNQIAIPSKDRDALRFLWFGVDGELVHYRMTRHLFGGVWCAASSAFALKTSVDLVPEVESVVRNAIVNSFYVDDMLQSVKSKEQATLIIERVSEVVAKCGFRLTKFVANDPDILACVAVDERAKEVKDLSSGMNSKVLGTMWDYVADTFQPSFEARYSGQVSRRAMLSTIASIFDPLGLLSPVVIMGKILFQDATRLKLRWDEEVPPDMLGKWGSWIDNLHVLVELDGFRIPRCIKPNRFDDGLLELHHFSDASERALGCCSYLRCLSKSGEISTQLVISRGKVAPLKYLSIAKLELQAAVMSARMDDFLRTELELECISSYFWVDSELALKYILNETRRFNVYVANRVGTIRSLTNTDQWHHVPGSENPADLITRVQRPQQLDVVKWFKGPEFLRTYKSEWGTERQVDLTLTDDDPEVKRQVVVPVKSSFAGALELDPMDRLFQHFSSWSKLKRAVAWLLRFKEYLCTKHRVSETARLSVAEIQRAEVVVLKYVQSRCYSLEISCLQAGQSLKKSSPIITLSPYLDDHGVLCVGGRLSRAPVEVVSRHQSLVPHNHPIAGMIALDVHKTAHLGTEWVVSLIREKYWVTKIRRVVKSVSYSCVPCRRKFAAPGVQKMADLPAERLCPDKPPFTFTGMDCFGPFKVKIGRSEVKRYGCVFTCLTTRAIHIEKLDSLDADSFLNGLRRFMSRRGCPSKIWCDNGTNFRGGFTEISKQIRDVDDSKINQYCVSRQVEWKFHPPSASHFGGIFERMIRSIRKVLVGLPECKLSDDMLNTLFCEVEYIINGRPITKLSEDVHDPSPLTPNHLLLMREAHTLAPGEFDQKDMYKRRWKCVQHLANWFWRKWLKFYIPELQKRTKWVAEKRNVMVGDLVMLVEENTPRGLWPLGVVVETVLGQDGLVRQVKVKTKATQLTRPITKVVLLEGCE